MIEIKIKVGVFGSCISRDPFNSIFNSNYSDNFEVLISAQRTSIISVMQKPIEIDDRLIYPKNVEDKFGFDCVKNDLNKKFIQEFQEKKIDCLIIDNYLETRFGMLLLDDSTIITNNHWDLPKTPFYNNLKDIKTLTLQKDSKKYFKLWKYYCKKFFQFLEETQPDIKLILNNSKSLGIVKTDNSEYIDNDLKNVSNEINPLWNKLNNFIIENFNVEVLNFDFENICCDSNHPWGLGQVHYTNNYYTSFIQELKKIMTTEKFEKKYLEANKQINELKMEISEKNREIKEYKKIISNFYIRKLPGENTLFSCNGIISDFNENWFIQNKNISIKRTSYGTIITKKGNGNVYPSLVSMKDSNYYTREFFLLPLVVEFDIVSVNGKISFRIYNIYDNLIFNKNLIIGHHKIILRDKLLEYWIDDVYQEVSFGKLTSLVCFGFSGSGVDKADLVYKNFNISIF